MPRFRAGHFFYLITTNLQPIYKSSQSRSLRLPDPESSNLGSFLGPAKNIPECSLCLPEPDAAAGIFQTEWHFFCEVVRHELLKIGVEENYPELLIVLQEGS